jgi:HEAT repeat protein
MKAQDTFNYFVSGVFALALMGCCDKASVPEHLQKLYSSQAKERNVSALALAKCGKLAEPGVPRLISLMYDSNVGVQSSAAYALREIGTPEALKALERAEAARAARRAKPTR